jgi:tRNA-dihydrouridine synthase A
LQLGTNTPLDHIGITALVGYEFDPYGILTSTIRRAPYARCAPNEQHLMTTELQISQRCFSVAPMMDWTDRHCRAFHRVLSQRALLYTEMVTSAAIIHGNRDHLLAFDGCAGPVGLQLGGSDPLELAEAARISADYGYDEINLNVGCPSDRVQSGRFGACLMAEPALVADCIAALREAVALPVTVKCRIGIDDQDDEADLQNFVETVAATGCSTFIVHARKAWLQGLSPAQNRDIPPLNYERVYRLKQSRPDLEIIINGGINTLAECAGHLEHVDGVMLGRAAYQMPWLLAAVDETLFGATAPVSDRIAAVRAFYPYIERQLSQGVFLSRMTRHMLGLFHAQPGGRLWRRHLSEHTHKPGAGIEVIEAALTRVTDAARPALAAE